MTLKTYPGSCICGAIKYEVTVDFQVSPTGRCNCMTCTKRRFWSLLLKPTALKLITPATKEDTTLLTDYQRFDFMHAKSCKVCSIMTFTYGNLEQMGGDFVGINVAALDMTVEERDAIPFNYANGKDNDWGTVPEHTKYL